MVMVVVMLLPVLCACVCGWWWQRGKNAAVTFVQAVAATAACRMPFGLGLVILAPCVSHYNPTHPHNAQLTSPTMKLSVGLLVLAATAVQAFLPPSFSRTRDAAMTMRQSPHDADASDRRSLVLNQVAFLGGSAALMLSSPSVVLADSTGKYSTKQTAKKRYLPRVRKGVALFAALGKTLDKPETIQAYNQYVQDNLATAMALYGSSTRIGELPDPKSRTVDKEAEDFVKEIKALAKGGDVKATYERAKANLVAYLAGTKLEPLGDAAYNEAPK